MKIPAVYFDQFPIPLKTDEARRLARDSGFKAILDSAEWLKCLVLFGSRARGYFDESSDYDFLVEPAPSYAQKNALIDALTAYLGGEVQLIDVETVLDNKNDHHTGWSIYKSILRDGVIIYSKDSRTGLMYGHSEGNEESLLRKDSSLRSGGHCKIRKVMRMETKIWNQSMETLSREGIERLQLERLRQTVTRVYQNVPFYRDQMQKKGLSPEDIRSLKDLALLPFYNKTDLRDHYPYGLFAAPMGDIVRLQASSGTTGKMTVVGYTASDIDVWAECCARCLGCAGADRDDVIHVAYGYGLFTGGLGAHYGGEKIGATVVPVSGGNTKRQITIMQDFGSTLLACTPSYALLIGETLREMGIDAKTLPLKMGMFGAEACTEGMRKEIEKLLDIKAVDIYGMAELIGPGVSCECSKQQGLHVWEDHFIPEIVDPETGEVLPEGAVGELVITTITKQGIPMIRYRTHDITSLNYAPCACGRTHARMNKITGRTDDMLIIRGVNVFPSQVETVLVNFAELRPHYLLVVTREHNMDRLEVRAEMCEDFPIGSVGAIQDLQARVEAELASTLSVSAKVRLMEPYSIERSEGKAKRILDLREKE